MTQDQTRRRDPSWKDGRWNAPPRPLLDMTPDGQFRRPAPFGAGLLRGAIVVAVLAGAVGVAALALWLALLLIPIAIGAGLIAYVALRFQIWRTRRPSFGGERNPLRR